MQIGIEDEPLAEEFEFRLERFLDLDDHRRLGPYLFGFVANDGSRLHVVGVGKARQHPGVRFDQHAVTGIDILAHRGRGQPDAAFEFLDFFHASYIHIVSPLCTIVTKMKRFHKSGDVEIARKQVLSFSKKTARDFRAAINHWQASR
jgi:hypothetical protein